MSRDGVIALEAQREECRAAIDDIKISAAPPGCTAHSAMARGLIALLRCKVAEIEFVKDVRQETKQTSAKTAGIVTAAMMLLYGVIQNLAEIVAFLKAVVT